MKSGITYTKAFVVVVIMIVALYDVAALFFFGVDALRRNYPMHWKILPLVPGLAVFILLFARILNAGKLPEPEASILLIVIGLGAILIGYFLQADNKAAIVEVNP